MNKISLFSGIGGDDIASEACGIKTVIMCERDKDCRKVLRYHFPGVPIIKDVKDVNYETVMAISQGWQSRQPTQRQGREDTCRGSKETIIADTRLLGQAGNGQQTAGIEQRGEETIRHAEKLLIDGCDTQREKSGTSIPELGNTDSTGDLLRGKIDIISGGFPCQPHSVAGKHLGAADERDLWGEFRRIIGEIKPRWVVAENVPGLFSTDSGRFFRGILRDLSEMGYSTGWCTFGAVDVGAWHRRDRVFIVAYAINSGDRTPGNGTDGNRQTIEQGQRQFTQYGISGQGSTTADSQCVGRQAGAGQGIQPEVQEAVGQDFGDICTEVQTTDPDSGRCSQCNTEVRQPSESDSDGDDANANTEGLEGYGGLRECGRQFTTRTSSESLNTRGKLESRMGDVVDGISAWLAEPDGVPRVAKNIKARVAKLKALGNAVVPAQIYQVYKAIVEIEELK